MSLRATRVLYRSYLRSVREVERRAPPVALAVIQKNIFGAENLIPQGSGMVRRKFRDPAGVRSLPFPFPPGPVLTSPEFVAKVE